MPVSAFNGNGLVSKLEILRGDLADVLYQATKDRTEYRFNTRIEELAQTDQAVQAKLSDGTSVSADLVVGCDGPHSAVRRLVFGPEENFVKLLGGYNAWFTAPDRVGLDGWYLMYQAPGLNASMRPSHDPAMCKAGLAFRSEPVAYDRRNADEQRALLAQHFAGAGWQCDALLSAAGSPPSADSPDDCELSDFPDRSAAAGSSITWYAGSIMVGGRVPDCRVLPVMRSSWPGWMSAPPWPARNVTVISPLLSPTTTSRRVRLPSLVSSTSLTRPSKVARCPGINPATVITDGPRWGCS